MKREIILIGGGGHCRSCIDVIETTGNYRIAGILDRPQRKDETVLGYPIVGNDDDLSRFARYSYFFLVTIGQIKSPERRRSLFAKLDLLKVGIATIVSPIAYQSCHARIGRGTIIMHQAIVNAGAEIGNNCIINTRTLIEHDAQIGDHCHISTGAIVNGGVRIGEGVFVGSGAVIREMVHIEEGAFIGANRTVARDIPKDKIVK